MISPRTILPAKPLLVGARPALAAALPPGTYYRERSGGIREYHQSNRANETLAASGSANRREGHTRFNIPAG
jgi:hypothetical protein